MENAEKLFKAARESSISGKKVLLKCFSFSKAIKYA